MATSRQRVYLDTNIILDMLDHERERHDEACALLMYAAERRAGIQLVSSITSFKDAYYIMCRLTKDEKAARNLVRRLMAWCVEPVDMLASYGPAALDSDEPDFEDALVLTCAMAEGASTIITRDERAFAGAPIDKMAASEFLERAGFDYEAVDF